MLQLSSEASQLSSWQANTQIATSWLGMGNNALNSTLSDMQSARTLLLQALNQGTQSTTTYQAIASQLQGINANLLDTANTEYEGRPIFAGTSASSQAYDNAGNYLGNADSPTVIVGPGSGAGQAVNLSVPGPTVFGTGAANVFTTLSTVIGQLGSGAPTATQLNTALERARRQHQHSRAGERGAGQRVRRRHLDLGGADHPAHRRPGWPVQSGGRQHRHRDHAVGFRDDQLPGRDVGGVTSHPRDAGEVPVRSATSQSRDTENPQ